MKNYQVNSGFEHAVALHKTLAVLMKEFVEEMLDKPFENYERNDMFGLRVGLTVEKAEEFLAKHPNEWAKLEGALMTPSDDITGAQLFIRLFEKINIHLHNIKGAYFVQFDYSKVIGRWWNVLSENSRGILYSYPDMNIVSLPFQKFYNLNERPHTQLQELNLNQPTHIMEKLDGSMIHVFESKGELYTATRGTVGGYYFNDVATELLMKTVNVEEVRALIQEGYTPIFELLLKEGDEYALIVKYPEEELRLIAVRNRLNGDYIHPTEIPSVAQKLGVKSAEFYHGMTLMDAISEKSHVKNMEGWVVYFEDGTMLKVKAEEYMTLLRPKDLELKMKAKPELLGRTVFNLMQENKLDDVMALIESEETKVEMQNMEETIHSILNGWDNDSRSLYNRHFNEDRGVFARAIKAEKPPKIVENITFALISGKEVEIKWEYIEKELPKVD